MALFTQLDHEVSALANQILYYSDPLTARVTSVDSAATGSAAVTSAAFLAKWFQPDSSRHEIEFDMQFSLKSALHIKPTDITLLPGKPEFVRVTSDVESRLLRTGNRNKHSNRLGLNPQNFNALNVAEILGKTRLDYALPVAMVAEHDVFQQTTSASNLTLTTKIEINDVKLGASLRTSFDEVVTIKAPWPFDFRTKPGRAGDQAAAPVWPSAEQREELMKTPCDLVAKPSSDGDVTLEWRWSFALQEQQLMKWLSADQLQLYTLVKIVFYRHISDVDPDNVRSYWIKTMLFWLAEEYPRDHELWRPENALAAIHCFYSQLLAMVDDWFLPHYFIPMSSLLLQEQRVTLQPRLSSRLRDIVSNTPRYVPTKGEFSNVHSLLAGPKKLLSVCDQLMLQLIQLCDAVFSYSWHQAHDDCDESAAALSSSDVTDDELRHRVEKMLDAKELFHAWVTTNQYRSYLFSKVLRYRHVIAHERGEERDAYASKPGLFSLVKTYHSVHNQKLAPEIDDFHEKFLHLLQNWDTYFVPSSILLQRTARLEFTGAVDKVSTIIDDIMNYAA